MSLHRRVNTLESEPGKRLVRILRDDEPEGSPSPTARRAPGGGYEVRHSGQWKPQAESYELLVIRIVQK